MAGFPMMHKGVEYTVSQSAPDVWQWQFRIGDAVISGKTETKIRLLPSAGFSCGSTANSRRPLPKIETVLSAVKHRNWTPPRYRQSSAAIALWFAGRPSKHRCRAMPPFAASYRTAPPRWAQHPTPLARDSSVNIEPDQGEYSHWRQIGP